MKREIDVPENKFLMLYRILMALLLTLAAVLVLGSIYAMCRTPGTGPLLTIGGKENAVAGDTPLNSEVSDFLGIGRLRIPLSAAGGTLILSITFPYHAQDSAFTEELASKTGSFRAIASEYFSTLPAGKTAALDEDAAKAEILKRYNALLRLGKIETLHFNDLMVIE
jgi:flagellar basal body-associated protein FliL